MECGSRLGKTAEFNRPFGTLAEFFGRLLVGSFSSGSRADCASILPTLRYTGGNTMQAGLPTAVYCPVNFSCPVVRLIRNDAILSLR